MVKNINLQTSLQVDTQPSTDLATSLAASMSWSWHSGSAMVGATTLAQATSCEVLRAHWVAALITWTDIPHQYTDYTMVSVVC